MKNICFSKNFLKKYLRILWIFKTSWKNLMCQIEWDITYLLFDWVVKFNGLIKNFFIVQHRVVRIQLLHWIAESFIKWTMMQAYWTECDNQSTVGTHINHTGDRSEYSFAEISNDWILSPRKSKFKNQFNFNSIYMRRKQIFQSSYINFPAVYSSAALMCPYSV